MSTSFQEFIRACGVIPPLVIEPGRWIRCATVSHPRKKNASVKLSDEMRIGWVHDFASMSEPQTWRDEGISKPFAIDAKEAASREAARRRDLIKATTEAREFYAACAPLRAGHEYLVKKGLDMTGCVGLKNDEKGALVVPMYYKGRVLSVQRIMPDGQKWFWSGATTKGAHYIIDRKGAVLTLLCEGLATGLTLFAAVPDSRVIVAFNSGNLEHVAKIVQIHGMCAVCADNDAATFERIGKNPGFDSATKAASTLGAGVALPECEAGTDFNDMLSEKLAALKEANLFRQGYKHTPAQILAEANATIRSRVMAGARFIAHAETITVTEKPTGEVCPKCWKEGRSLWARSCACLPGWPNFTTNQEKNNTL